MTMMDDQVLVSKKELLALTGISYGQLYRWKRQNLIPESWFIKQSSFTGQETYFPKGKILKRVETILELKDQYSLEELAEMFTPELTSKIFRLAVVREIAGFNPTLLAIFSERLGKDKFTFRELLFTYALSEIERRLSLGESWLNEMVDTVKGWLPFAKSSAYRLLICHRTSGNFSFLLQEDTDIYLDGQSDILISMQLNELANELHGKLNGLEELR